MLNSHLSPTEVLFHIFFFKYILPDAVALCQILFFHCPQYG